MMWGKKVENHRNQVWRTMTHTPLQDEYQVDLSRLSRPRWGKPVLANIPSRLLARGPNPTRTEHNDPLQGEMPVVRTWSDKNIFNYLPFFISSLQPKKVQSVRISNNKILKSIKSKLKIQNMFLLLIQKFKG